MIRRLKARIGNEEGIALITAMLVSMVVVILGATSVSLSIHNSEQSANDRRRVQNVNAAEAGLNYYYSHIQSVPASSLACSITKTLSTTPVTTFTTTATYYNSSGTALACPVSSGQIPVNAHLRSVGTTAGKTNQTRIMETYMRLTPITGGALTDTVVFSQNSFNWSANVSIKGADASNNNVYTNGTASFNSSTAIYGNVYAQGGISLRGNAQLRRDAWANGAISMSNNTSVLGNATSSTSSITLANNAKIYGNARAGTSITAGAGKIGGTRTPNSPQGPPPVKAFPAFTYDAAAWTADGYQISTHNSCNPALNFINSITTGNWVVRITSDCTLTLGSKTIRGHLAIVSDGAISFNKSKYTAVGGPWNLHYFAGLDGDGPPCDIYISNNSSWGTNLKALFHTPCAATIKNNVSVAGGQFIAGTMNIGPNTTITYAPVTVPGVAGDGFKEDILYIREVRV